MSPLERVINECRIREERDLGRLIQADLAKEACRSFAVPYKGENDRDDAKVGRAYESATPASLHEHDQMRQADTNPLFGFGVGDMQGETEWMTIKRVNDAARLSRETGVYVSPEVDPDQEYWARARALAQIEEVQEELRQLTQFQGVH